MEEPIDLVAATPRCALPYLYPAQAQKELFVNRALARTDLLLHAAIEGIEDDPPAQPVEGACWIVGSVPAGAWRDRAGQLAGWIANGWQFLEPCEGMWVFDRSRAVFGHYAGGWHWPTGITAPDGGTQIDREARDAILQLIDSLRRQGLLSAD